MGFGERLRASFSGAARCPAGFRKKSEKPVDERR
jgi:hypothetical protein